MSQDNQSLYKKLKELRRERGLTVETLAKKMGENAQKVGRLERGNGNVTVGYLTKISGALNIPIESLLEDQKCNQFSPSSHTHTLNEVVVFIEEYCQKHSMLINPLQKGQLISKLYEMALKFPKEHQALFLSSLSEFLQMNDQIHQKI